MPGLQKYEVRLVSLIGLVAIVVAFLPYALSYLLAPRAWEFGGVVMNFEDSHGYLAKMNQGAAGNLTYQIPFTSEEHESAFVGGFFLALGWICALTGLPVMWMWHLSRIVFGFLLLLSAYLFIALFLEDVRQRLVAYVLVCFSAGFGWVVLLTGRFSILGFDLIDFKMPEAHAFFTLLTFPHFAVGATLLLIIFILALLFYRTLCWRYALLAGAAGFLLAIVHPYNLLVAAGSLGLWLLIIIWRERRLPFREISAVVIIGLSALPPFLYYLYVFATNPAFGAWAAQSGSPSPHPLHYLIGYGPLLILGLPAMAQEARRMDTQRVLPLLWVIVVALLLYAPLKQQRRMVEGVHVPLSLLATLGLYTYYLPRWGASRWLRRLLNLRNAAYSPRRMRRFLIFLALILTIPSNLYILASLAATAVMHPYPFFHEREENEAIAWLEQQTAPEHTVLAAYETGSYIPSRIKHRVFAGYWAETAYFDAKVEMIDRFFQSHTPDAWRREFLKEYDIGYLFYGPREALLGDFDPVRSDLLSPVFANEMITIYRVAEQEL
ncbi:MAG: hypothetical protein OEV76_01585 [Anaerolineae bacterium]|nr:hypothetical protein [Anaerolineae bacterium]